MFIITVKDTEGFEVNLRPGGVAERQIITEVLDKLKAEGVGIFRTEATVLAAVEKAIKETLYALKSDVLP